MHATVCPWDRKFCCEEESDDCCACSQDSLQSVPSLEAARLAVLGPSYSGSTVRPSSANSGEPCFCPNNILSPLRSSLDSKMTVLVIALAADVQILAHV